MPLICNDGTTNSSVSRDTRYSTGTVTDSYPENRDTCFKFTTTAQHMCCSPGIYNYTARIYGIKKANQFINFYCSSGYFYYLVEGNIEQDLGSFNQIGMILKMEE